MMPKAKNESECMENGEMDTLESILNIFEI
jgi:hypothetical protein